MRIIFSIIVCTLLFVTSAVAQDSELQLARQYSANGEQQKALEIFQKLYKQDNETYFTYYINILLNLKQFNEAENATRKLIRKHAGAPEYQVMLGTIYTQQGNLTKADAIYDKLLKDLPPTQMEIVSLANQFYQNANIDYAIKIFLQGRKLLHDDGAFSYELINLYRFKRDKISLTQEYLNFLPLSPNFVIQAQNTFASIFEDDADYNLLKAALLRKIQKDPQQAIYTQLLTWLFMQQKEYSLALNQAIALSRRQNDDGGSIFELCRAFNSNNAYDEAIRGYEYIIEKGASNPLYVSSKIELINTKNLKITAGKYEEADLLGLEQDYKNLLAEFGSNNNTVFAIQRLANLQAFNLHKLNDAQKLLESAIAIPNVSSDMLASCKLDLGDVYLFNKLPWEATLLYSQVEKDFPNTAIAQDARLRNAKLAYYTGDFTWAKGQLDVLKAATSQLIANDALNLLLLINDNTAADSSGAALKVYARADLLIFAKQTDKALLTLDSIDKKYPGNSLSDDILMLRSRIMIQEKDYTGAVNLLKKIYTDHPADLWADDAVFMLGDIYENHLADKESAKNWYQKIITNYPGSLWINEARKRFRSLRGDKVDS